MMTDEVTGMLPERRRGVRALNAIALRVAYAARGMCRAMLWVTPVVFAIALGIAVIHANGTHSRWLEDVLLVGPDGNPEFFPFIVDEVLMWLVSPLLIVAYSLWCSRSMTDMISSLDGRLGLMEHPLLAEVPLTRHWVGAALFSCVLSTGPLMFVPYAVIFLISGIPGIMVNLGITYGLVSSCPTLRATLRGIGLMGLSTFFAGIAAIVFAVAVGMIKYAFGVV